MRYRIAILGILLTFLWETSADAKVWITKSEETVITGNIISCTVHWNLNGALAIATNYEWFYNYPGCDEDWAAWDSGPMTTFLINEEGRPGAKEIKREVTFQGEMGEPDPDPEEGGLAIDVKPPTKDKPQSISVAGSVDEIVNIYFDVMHENIEIDPRFDGCVQARVVRPNLPPDDPIYDSDWQPAPPSAGDPRFYPNGSTIVDRKYTSSENAFWVAAPVDLETPFDSYGQTKRIMIRGCNGNHEEYQFGAYVVSACKTAFDKYEVRVVPK